MKPSRWAVTTLNRVINYQLEGLTISAPCRSYSTPTQKRPPTAFLLFYREKLPEIKQLHKDSPNSVTRWSKTAGSMWKELDESSRNHYKDLFLSQQQKYLSNLTAEEAEHKKKLSLEKREKNQKRRHKQEAKGLNKPKRPPTAHGLYIREKTSLSHLSQSDMKPVFTQLGHDWKTMSESDREKYVKDATERRQMFEKELCAWEDDQINQGRKHLVRVSRLKALESAAKSKKSSSKKQAKA